MSEISDSSGIVARGAFLLTLFQLASKVLYLVFFILLGNLPDILYGRLEWLLALGSVFFILSDFGIETWLTRELAKDPRAPERNLTGVSSLKTILTLFASALLALWILQTAAAGWEAETRPPWVVLGCMVYMAALSLQSYIRSIARAHHRFEIEGAMAVADKFFTLLFGAAVFFLARSLLGLMAAFALAGTAAALYGLIRIRPLGLRLAPVSLPEWSVMRKAYPFALSGICVLLFYYMDRLMIPQLLEEGDAALARYSRGWRIVMGLLLFPQMMSVAIYPMFSKLTDRPADRAEVGAASLRTLLFLAFPLMVGGWATAGPLLDLLFPQGDPHAPNWRWDAVLGWDASVARSTESAVLRILLLSLPFTCCNYLFGPALNALGKERLNLAASAVTLLANVGLNLLLIPRLGPVGAAAATSITQFLYSASMYFFLRRTEASWISGIALWGYLGLAFGMGGAITAMGDLPVYLSIPLGGILYLTATGIMVGWPEEMKRLLPGRFR